MRTRRTALVVAVLAVAAVFGWGTAASALVQTFTDDADFKGGTLVGLDMSVPDQLQLSQKSVTLPFIWVPNLEGTVSKVNTETGKEIGRYLIGPTTGVPSGGWSPSRTTVDQQGACYVGMRQAGTVVKIGLYEAGQWIDRNNDGKCQTSQDTNGNGVIDAAEVLPWGEDECVLYQLVLVAGVVGNEGPYVPGTYAGPYDYELLGHFLPRPGY